MLSYALEIQVCWKSDLYRLYKMFDSLRFLYSHTYFVSVFALKQEVAKKLCGRKYTRIKKTKHFVYFSSFTDKISKFYLSKRCGNRKIVFVSSRPYFGLFFIPIHVPRA